MVPGQGDFVRFKADQCPPGWDASDVFKIDSLHYHRVPSIQEDGRVAIAACLLAPYDNPNKFINVPLFTLEKVEPKADKKDKK